MNTDKVKEQIARHFKKIVEKNKGVRNAHMLVHSDQLGIHINMAEGMSGDIAAHPEQPYFVASVGKLFTSVLIGILVERGYVRYDDPISLYLEPEIVRGLHLFKGRDYSNNILIKHLLSHRSGLPCFLEDSPKESTSIIDLLLAESERFWTPQEVLRWTKEHLSPRFQPGRGFHYSDTGYHLLGLIIERLTGLPFHISLSQYLFEPLQMKNTSFNLYSKPMIDPKYPDARIYAHGIDITNYRSLSISFAGGGIISTNEDLLFFMKALVNNQILKAETIELMMKERSMFVTGIDYGYGLMVTKTIPILMPKKYYVWGNAGTTGSFLFYHPELDTYLVGSLNHFRYNRKAIRLMFRTVDILTKTQHK